MSKPLLQFFVIPYDNIIIVGFIPCIKAFEKSEKAYLLAAEKQLIFVSMAQLLPKTCRHNLVAVSSTQSKL
jgi:hypothetical protein